MKREECLPPSLVLVLPSPSLSPHLHVLCSWRTCTWVTPHVEALMLWLQSVIFGKILHGCLSHGKSQIEALFPSPRPHSLLTLTLPSPSQSMAVHHIHAFDSIRLSICFCLPTFCKKNHNLGAANQYHFTPPLALTLLSPSLSPKILFLIFLCCPFASFM